MAWAIIYNGIIFISHIKNISHVSFTFLDGQIGEKIGKT